MSKDITKEVITALRLADNKCQKCDKKEDSVFEVEGEQKKVRLLVLPKLENENEIVVQKSYECEIKT